MSSSSIQDEESQKKSNNRKFVPEDTHLRIIEGIMNRVVLNIEKDVMSSAKNDDETDSDWSSSEEDEEEEEKVVAHVELIEDENDDDDDDDDNDDEEIDFEATKHDHRNNKIKESKPLTTKNEVLPTIRKDFEFEIRSDDTFAPAGTVFNIVSGSVIVVEGMKNTVEPLRSGTVLCTEKHEVLGEIDELFGPVSLPYYIMRNVNQTRTDLVKEGEKVVAVARTRTVVDTRMRILMEKEKGSDASNVNDEEAENVEFSDDESEKEYKKRMKRTQGLDKRKRRDGADTSGVSSSVQKPVRQEQYRHSLHHHHRYPHQQHYNHHPRRRPRFEPPQLPYHLPPTRFTQYQQHQPYDASNLHHHHHHHQIPPYMPYNQPRPHYHHPQYQPFGGMQGGVMPHQQQQQMMGYHPYPPPSQQQQQRHYSPRQQQQYPPPQQHQNYNPKNQTK